MYNCYKLKSYAPDRLTRMINSWFFEHPNVQLINISIIRDDDVDSYHAFITYADKDGE